MPALAHPTKSPQLVHTARVACLVMAAALAVRCGSSSHTATGPSPVKCQVSLSSPSSDLDAAGGTGSVAVTADPECAWTASTGVSWISNLSPVSGQGAGRVEFRVPANPAPSMRQGDIIINGTNALIRQNGSACRYQVSAPTAMIDAGGGTAAVSVATEAGCTWTASAVDPWIAVVSGERGDGNGTVTLRALANDGDERTAVMTVAGQTVSMTQAGRPCSFAIDPNRVTVGPTADQGPPVMVETANGCTWRAVTETPWITVTSPDGRGPGRVTYDVATNGGNARRGTIAVGGQTFVIDQDPATSCTFAVTPSSLTIAASGGTGAPLSVTTTGNCSWTSASNAPWITVTPGGSRTGSGSVTLSVAPNSGAARSGSVTVAGRTVTVSQDAAPAACTYALAPSTQSAPASGGAGTPIQVTTTAGCAWSAASSVPWITIGAGANGVGSGSVAFTVAGNTGGDRTGLLTIGGQTATVTQSAAAVSPPVSPPVPPQCTYSVSPLHDAIGASGGTGTTIAVSSAAGCSWSASTDAPWITIVSGATGSGNGSIAYTASANPGSRRSGNILAADKTVVVEQAAASCDYAIGPSTQNIAAGGGAGTAISVTTGADCTWTASSEASWLTITTGASGRGNGTVEFTAAANTGSARTGDLVIAGRRASIAQGAGSSVCTYSISPGSATLAAAGGTGPSITVTTTAGCAWTAASSVPWLTVTSGAAGSGGGTVTYSAAANTGAQRTGDLTVAGRMFSVTQAAAPACSYSIAPAGAALAASGGAGSPVTVTTAAGCAWTATSNAPWLTVTSGASGTGGGTVAYSAAANTSAQRMGTLTIAGQTFSVTQSAAPVCSYSIAPGGVTLPANGGAGSPVTVTATAGCAWTATSNAPWLTITGGTSGTGGGSVAYSATANTGAQRMGTLTIAGQTFNVTQLPACSFSINPTSQTAAAGGGAGTPIAVTAANGCAWTATSSATWLTVTTGASGSGNGSVAFTIAANTGPQRMGTLTVAGQTFTVTQSAPAPSCTYSISPTSDSIMKNGGTGPNITVTAQAGCSWTAVSNVAWISIRSGESGTGNGTVSFRVERNDGEEQRVGTMTIAGRTFTVTQAGR